MINVLIFSSIFFITDTTEDLSPNVSSRIFNYSTYEYDQLITVAVNNIVEHILAFNESNDKWKGYPTRVHVASNDIIDGEYPIFITATQQKGISSWELPLVVRTSTSIMQFNDMARTLCPHDAGSNITSLSRPLLHVSTSKPTNVTVGIKVRRVQDFYVEVNEEIQLTVTPSTPKYYYFSFDRDSTNSTITNMQIGLPRFNYTVPKSVILIIESDDDICGIVSIQNNSCPVFDNEEDISYQGYHLTMTNKGGITLTQTMFPVGFYIVFIVKQRDEDCTGVSEMTIRPQVNTEWNSKAYAPTTRLGGRVKHFKFRVIATISYTEYMVGAVVMLALTSLVAVLVLLVMLPFSRCQWKEEIVIVSDEPTPGPSTSNARSDNVKDEVEPIIKEVYSSEDSMSDGETDEISKQEWTTRPLTVAGLSQAKPVAHARRSDRYFWNALTVAVVYALPVVQLLGTYQHMVFQTGDQDLCYYNFLCAHPLGFLSDFNHVYSNVGYVILGLVFMLQTRHRQVNTSNRPQKLGIPQHHGLFYCMGFALLMEGLLSGCYHLCPNKMNFQFDSSFMYVIAVVSMVKLYQNRHPDVNASAHSTFMLIAVIMALGVFGIMYPSTYFWVLFTLLHIATCLILTLNIYYLGRFKFDRVWGGVRVRGWRALVPARGARAALLGVANLANWGLAAYGLYDKKDFARHLLAILMSNTILYTIFYVLMKLVHREKILPHTWLYLIFAHIAWFTAIKLFLASKTKWSQTPAQSRRYNAECSALQFYDTHDLWHLASASALFLSFNMLLTIDDALVDTPRENIPVF